MALHFNGGLRGGSGPWQPAASIIGLGLCANIPGRGTGRVGVGVYGKRSVPETFGATTLLANSRRREPNGFRARVRRGKSPVGLRSG